MKVILTNVNHDTDSNANLLSYFSSYYNQGIPPGGFMWSPGTVVNEPFQRSPWQSMQIFQEYMDDESLLAPLVPLSGEAFAYANLTSAILNCTTADNPAFRIKAGQKVQILLIRLNSIIPTNIITPSSFTKWRIPMAEQTRYVATASEMASRIREFVSS
jgi:hypothetical protein